MLGRASTHWLGKEKAHHPEHSIGGGSRLQKGKKGRKALSNVFWRHQDELRLAEGDVLDRWHTKRIIRVKHLLMKIIVTLVYLIRNFFVLLASF